MNKLEFTEINLLLQGNPEYEYLISQQLERTVRNVINRCFLCYAFCGLPIITLLPRPKWKAYKFVVHESVTMSTWDGQLNHFNFLKSTEKTGRD